MKRMILACLTGSFYTMALAVTAADKMSAQVVVLGEVHDNPTHHLTQATEVAALQPKAVVFEMLTAEQAARITPTLRDNPQALAEVLDWTQSGWPDFSLYEPVFAALGSAAILGAGIPRDKARVAMKAGLVESFAGDASAFGLDQPLPEDEQAARLQLQQTAHCNALPEHLLPMMVELQRLRDAELARITLQALQMHGAPVAVITGNGHARKDWGMPALLQTHSPEISVFVLGQSEGGAAPEGVFDAIIDAPTVDRPDPCAAFAKQN